MKKLCLIFFAILISINFGLSQTLRFENEILNFEKQDQIKMPKKQANLFAGSSSIRLWQNIIDDFDGYPIISRGFGGSTLQDLDLVIDRIITKYEPAKIFIYAGENDIAEGATAQETFERFRGVFTKIRASLPAVPIVYISIKPSIARQAQFETQTAANLLIKSFLNTESNAEFANIVKKMLIRNMPNPSLYIADKLHMNQKGYEIWTKKLKHYLLK
jgi:lysophospholipase L1-like esterase